MTAPALSARLPTQGPFSLRAAAGFGFGPHEGRPPAFDDDAMRLAFPVDGGTGYAGVVARQAIDDGPVELELLLTDGAPAEAAARQVARILSLDHDGDAFVAVGESDPVLGRLQRAHPGQRPVLFHSPYEAAAWSVISAAAGHPGGGHGRRIADQLGVGFTLAGQQLAAFPQPAALLEIGPGPGLPEEKVARLHGVARAALDGDLEAGRLHELGHERALESVQQIRGIGPFYAGLIVLRSAGFADAVLSVPEPQGLAHAQRFYGLDQSPTLDEFAALAERWRPFAPGRSS